MKTKKLVALVLVAVLAITSVVGGTLAYFQDKDSKVNTFAVGNVDIHIEEWMEDKDGKWVEYKDQKLAPIARSKAPFNKLVETVNDGSEAAYIRTFITCPAELYNQLGYGFNAGENAKDGTRVGGKGTLHCLDSWTDLGKTTVDGKEVYIFVCEHEEAIPAGDSILSLTKVRVYENVTNTQIGESFEVKVVSEAIQAENLTYEEAMTALNGGKEVLAHAASLF